MSNTRNFESRDFKSLRVWELSQEITTKVYQITKNYPVEERYAITSQMRRSASSIGANTAEGNSITFFPNKELSFYANAKGSSDELRSWLDLSLRLGYINKVTYEELEEATQEVIRLLIALMRRVRSEIA